MLVSKILFKEPKQIAHQNPAWMCGSVCVCLCRLGFFCEMVSAEQTHPANRVNNAHRAHPSIFTCFDLTSVPGILFLNGSAEKNTELSLSISLLVPPPPLSTQLFLFTSPERPDVPVLFPLPDSLHRHDAGERDGEIVHGEEQPSVPGGPARRRRRVHV